MSWFGTGITGGISQITGQLSNFTKEVLTEGTEEVDDHATELKITKEKLYELQGSFDTQKLECERLSRLCDEWKDRAESAELQIAAVSSEYRNLLMQKEEDLKRVQRQLYDVLHSQTSLPGDSTSSFRGDSHGTHHFHGDTEREITFLRAQVQSFERECEQLKQEVHGHASSAKDTHQAELAALHDAHVQRVSGLKKKHKEETQQLTGEIQELRQQIAALSERHGSTDGLLQRVQEADHLAKTLQEQNEQVLAEKNQLLSSTQGLQQELLQLKDENQEIKQRLEDLQMQLQALRKESGRFDAPPCTPDNSQELLLEDLRNQVEEYRVAQTDWQLEKDALEEVLMKLRDQVREREEAEGSKEATQNKHHEVPSEQGIAGVDDDDDPEENGDVEKKLRQELQKQRQIIAELEDELSFYKIQTGTSSSDNSKLAGLQSSILKLQQLLSQKQQQVTQLQEANETAVFNLREKTDEVAGLQVVMCETEELLRKREVAVADIQQRVEELEGVLAKQTEDMEELANQSIQVEEIKQERDALMLSMDELDRQHEEAIAKIINKRDELLVHNRQLQEQLEEVKNESAILANATRDTLELKQQLDADRVSELEQQCQQLKRELEQNACQLKEQQQLKENLEVHMEKQDQEHKRRLKEVEEELRKVRDESETFRDDHNRKDEETIRLQQTFNDLTIVAEDRAAQVNDLLHQRRDLEEHLQEMGELQQKVCQLEAQLQKISTERNQYKEQLEKLTDVQGNTEVVEESLRRWKDENLCIKNDLATMSERCALVQHDLQQAVDRSAYFEQQLCSLTEQMDSQAGDLRASEQSLHTKEQELTAALQHMAEVESQKRLLEGNCSELEKEVERLVSELSIGKPAFDKSGLEQSGDNATMYESFSSDTSLLGVTPGMGVENSHEVVQKLQMTIESLCSQKEALENELSRNEHRHQERVKELESCITELGKQEHGRSEDQQVQYNWLLKKLQEKEQELEELQAQMDHNRSDLDYTKDMLQSTMDGQSRLTNLIDEKETELARLQRENMDLQEATEKMQYQLKEQSSELSRLGKLDGLYKVVCEDNRKVKNEMDSLRKMMKDLETQEAHVQVETRTLDIITELEEEITGLSKSLAEKEAIIVQLDEDKARLNITVDEKQQALSRLSKEVENIREQLTTKEKSLNNVQMQLDESSAVMDLRQEQINNLANSVEGLKNELTEKQEQLLGYQQRQSKHEHTWHSQEPLVEKNLEQHIENIVNGSNQDHAVEVMNMRKLLADRDLSIAALNEKVNSLNQMIQTVGGGEGNLMNIWHLEKDRMLQILNDKTRECSQLKAEVHRLMSVVTADKSALAKLQQDNHHLQTGNGPRHQDMSREAIHKLSSIVKDKDMEIEALKQKNDSLLQVLQDGSDGSQKLAAVVQERDTLLQHQNYYLHEREQLAAAITAKHQESLAYQAEVERLNSKLASESEGQERLQLEYESLQSMFHSRQEKIEQLQQELLGLKDTLQQAQVGALESRNKLASTEELYQRLMAHKEALQKDNTELKQKIKYISVTQSTGKHSRKLRDVYVQTMQGALPQAHVAASEQADMVQEEVDTGEPVGASASAETTHHNRHSTPSTSQLYDELEALQAVLQNNEETFTEKDRLLTEKDHEMGELRERIQTQEQQLNEREHKLSELSSRFHRTEQMLRMRDSEMTQARKQNESLTFEVEGLRVEVEDLKAEKEALTSRNYAIDSQLEMVKEANTKLSVSIKDHAFELNALKEKNNTLTKLMQEKHSMDTEKGEMDRLLKETETLQQQARAFKIDADQFAMALQQQQEENRELKTEINRLQEREQKLSREVERLRCHLMSVEEGYTKELLEAEEREKDLRDRLATAEERALSATGAIDRASMKATRQLEQYQGFAQRATEEKQSAMSRAIQAEEQAEQYAMELRTLQAVLEQFTLERESQLSAETEKYQRQLNKVQTEYEHLQKRLFQTESKLQETSEALEAAERLSEQLDRKEALISALRMEVQSREGQLQQAEDEITRLSASNEAKVDKALAKNLIIGYFHTPANKKAEVLEVIAKALAFSDHEVEQLKGDMSGGWLKSIFRRSTQAQLPRSRHNTGVEHEKSFSELFVSFLERESAPVSTPRLTAEDMAQRQATERSQQFNPFSVPVAQAIPSSPAAGQAQHILMQPFSPSLPLLSPSPSSHPAVSSPMTLLASPSQSLRPAPSTNSFLRDMLQQT